MQSLVRAALGAQLAAPTHELGSRLSFLDFPVPIFVFRYSLSDFWLSGSRLFLVSSMVPNVLLCRYFECRSWSKRRRVPIFDFRVSSIGFPFSSLRFLFSSLH